MTPYYDLQVYLCRSIKARKPGKVTPIYFFAKLNHA